MAVYSVPSQRQQAGRFVQCPDLVLEEDWGVEVRNLGIDRFAYDFTLTCMEE